MLVTLDEMKTYLGIALGDVTYDVFLTEQITLFSSTIENYCGRVFGQGSYVQTVYPSDYIDQLHKGIAKIFLYHFPLITMTSIKEIEIMDSGNLENTLTVSTDYRIQKEQGSIIKVEEGIEASWFRDLSTNSMIEVTFDAGYADIPIELKHVTYQLVEQAYNKKINNVSLSFGNDVQRVSIPGTISIDFDYSLQANERSAKFGMFIGNFSNILDYFRSERTLIGQVRNYYVD